MLIEEIVEDIKSSGGIILGNTETSTNQKIGRVISIGNLVQEVSLGDKVLFDSYKSFPIDIEGKTYIILEQDSVIGVYI